MKKFSHYLVATVVLFISASSLAVSKKIDGLYVNSYGNQSDPALIFVHGGPGYHSQDFEWSTASALAAQGFFVVVYDQRGQGRSDLANDQKDYTYQKYADDIKLIVTELKLKSPTLIGHSHGGPISLKVDQIYPGLVSRIILVSGPVNFWKSLDSIRINCTSRYAAVGDTSDANKINADFSSLNSNPSLEDAIKAIGDIFQLGLNKPCALYTPAQPTTSAIDLHKTVAKQHIAVAQENLFYPMGNFVVNEQYIHVDQTQWVRDHADHIFGIYGNEDGLFTPDVLADIKGDLSANPSTNRFQLIKGASHAVYIDQQEAFIEAVKNTFK